MLIMHYGCQFLYFARRAGSPNQVLTHAARAAAKQPFQAPLVCLTLSDPPFEANRFKNRGRVRAAYNLWWPGRALRARRALVRVTAQEKRSIT